MPGALFSSFAPHVRPGAAWRNEGRNEDEIIMDVVALIDTNGSSPVARIGLVFVGCLALYVAFKVGGFILKVMFGLVFFGRAIWWFLSRP